MFDIVHAHHPQVHCYADDTQLYLSFSPDVVEDQESGLLTMESCIDDTSQWMFANGLFLNDCKSEFIIIGTHQQCAKVKLRNIMIGQSSINSKVLVCN